ncbi:MAG TPA: ChbG/HpnK family deacetylase [Thermoanaerobaculia bacterium]|nr:ChbG/HpnK family deacetylase [Thermoanaerobaculia bacterium]
MKRLIVTADDVGLHPGMTEGAIRAHRDGIVTACSIVANGAAFDDAVTRLREVPSLEVGVHLTLVEERPLTAMRFPKKWPMFLPLYALRAISMRDVERELRAQIERVLATGLRVTHLNGHQHLHVLPRIFAVVQRLARDYRIGYVRRVDDRGGRVGLARRAAIAGLSAIGRRANGSNDRTIGVAIAGHLDDVVPLLDHVDGVTELVTHPGVNVSGYAWGYDWDAETRALCAAGLREEIARRGIALIAPSQVSLTAPAPPR